MNDAWQRVQEGRTSNGVPKEKIKASKRQKRTGEGGGEESKEAEMRREKNRKEAE